MPTITSYTTKCDLTPTTTPSLDLNRSGFTGGSGL